MCNGRTLKRKLRFFLIGAAKCGTTFLYNLITQHPKVYGAEKETQYFYKDRKYRKGDNWYLKTYYSDAKENQIYGDGTPRYMYFADRVIPRLQKFIHTDETIFIVLLRDPVRRAWSNYLYRKYRGKETLSFSEALAKEKKRINKNPLTFSAYKEEGRYGKYLQKWINQFGRENFLIFTLCNLKENYCDVSNKIYTSMGLEKYDSITLPERNASRRPLSQSLVRAFTNPPEVISKVFRTLVPIEYRHRVRKKLFDILTIGAVKERQKIPPYLESKLYSFYREDISLLESVTKKSFDQWKK